MKVKELMEKLKDVDPEIDVVTEAPDHGYARINVAKEEYAELGWRYKQQEYFEYFDDENMQPDSVKKKVLVIV